MPNYSSHTKYPCLFLPLPVGLVGLIPLIIGAVWDGTASSFFLSMSVCVGESTIHRYDDAHVG